MSTENLNFKCDVCGREYTHGSHRYDGHKLLLYGGVFACDPCWMGNHDGWAPHLEERLLELLNEKKLPVPPRIANRLLPRD